MGKAAKTSSKGRKRRSILVEKKNDETTTDSTEIKATKNKSTINSSESQLLSLDVSNQKKFKKNTKKLQKKLQKKGAERIRKKFGNGAVYLSRIPHGFFETGMEKFFSQFGDVTEVKIARSRRTSRSMGYAYICFLNKEVAEIVAETMNNYLMFGKLMKCCMVPMHIAVGQMRRLRGTTEHTNPLMINRNKHIKMLNKNSTTKLEEMKKNSKLTRKYLRKLEKLEEIGVNVDLFSHMIDETAIDEENNTIDYTGIEKEIVASDDEDSDIDDNSEVSDSEDSTEKIDEKRMEEEKTKMEEMIFNKLKNIRKQTTGVKRKRQ